MDVISIILFVPLQYSLQIFLIWFWVFEMEAEEDFYRKSSGGTVKGVAVGTPIAVSPEAFFSVSALCNMSWSTEGWLRILFCYNLFESQDTPKTVQLHSSDTVMVWRKQVSKPPKEAAADNLSESSKFMDNGIAGLASAGELLSIQLPLSMLLTYLPKHQLLYHVCYSHCCC